MFIKKKYFVLGLLIMVAFQVNSALALPGAKIEGVWRCTASRPDSSTFPLTLIFHPDGTMAASSGSDLFGAGYSSRGGLIGEWEKVGSNLYNYKSLENLYKNVNETIASGFRDKIGGTFYVNVTFYFDPDSDTLCSGFSPSNSCSDVPGAPSEAITLLKRISNDGTDNFSTDKASNKCVRLETVFQAIFP